MCLRFTSNGNCHFSSENRETPRRVVDFLLGGDTQTKSTTGSMVCLWTRSCGPGGSARLAGRLPPGSSSYKLKSTGWGGGVFRTLAVSCNSLSSSPALTFFCPREEGCNDVARAAATLSSSGPGLLAEVHRKRCKHTKRGRHFSSEKAYHPKRVVDFLLERDTHSETKSWKSLMILTKKVTTTTVNPGNRRGFCV